MKKQESPVRNFLDEPYQVKSPGDFTLSGVQQSLMFDKKITTTIDSYGKASKVSKTSDDFVILLKCMRLWKTFVRNQLEQKAELAQEMALNNTASFVYKTMSLDYSGQKDQYDMANIHYYRTLASKTISSIIMYVVEETKAQQETRSEIEKV